MGGCIYLENYTLSYVLSDFHGDYKSFKDSLKIILPEIEEKGRYIIFLGDNIDRFPKSKEIIEELIYLKESYGEKIVLLVGNHEYQYLGGPPCYPRTYIPTSKEIEFMKEDFVYVVIGKDTIFLHGGIPKNFQGFKNMNNETKLQIVWNDPDPRAKDFLPSPRTGFDPTIPIYLYGQKQLNEFLKTVNKRLLISGHGHVNDTPLFGQVRVCSSRISRDNRRSFLKVHNSNVERVEF